MVRCEILGRDEILEQRSDLLERAGMSEADLRLVAGEYRLSSTQEAILDRINDLDYLMQAYD